MPPKRRAAAAVATIYDPKIQKIAKAAGAVKDDENDVAKPAAAASVVCPKIRWEFEEKADTWLVHTESDAINNAVQSNKKTVTVMVDDAVNDERVTVKMDKMTHVKKNSRVEQRLRVAFADPHPSPIHWSVWEYEDITKKWMPYAFGVATALESAHVNQRDDVEVKLGRVLNIFDRSAMTLAEKRSPETITNVRRVTSVAKLDLSANTAPTTAIAVPIPTVKPVAVAKTNPRKNISTANTSKKTEDNIRTVVLKGKAPVDPLCVSKIGNAHVFYDHNEIYDVMLNQTNLQRNNNKFYLMQLLEDDVQSPKRYSVWFRWGRVGNNGQKSLNEFEDLELARRVFEIKFYQKTGNDWNCRSRFEKYEGFYDLVKMDYDVSGIDKSSKKLAVKKDINIPESTLDPRLKDLISLICDVNAMEAAVLEMKYDAQKAPLGKLTTEQIEAGYKALKEIEDAINQKASQSELILACNSFYTKIPHSFGRKQPPLISTLQEIKAKIQLLDALGDIQVAVKMLKEAVNDHGNPIDNHYKRLDCDLRPLNENSREYEVISKYLKHTHEASHRMYTLKMLNVFECIKKDEVEQFVDHGNRMLLWHGSRLTNWAGILKRGLRIAPVEAPVTGYMFGKGIYFADRSSKSANYCYATSVNDIGLLLLCEVSLGKCHELLTCDNKADKLPPNHHSVKGRGFRFPDEKENHTLPDGTVVPLGSSVTEAVKEQFNLNFNEYVIYNRNQVKMRYLVQVEFGFRR